MLVTDADVLHLRCKTKQNRYRIQKKCVTWLIDRVRRRSNAVTRCPQGCKTPKRTDIIRYAWRGGRVVVTWLKLVNRWHKIMNNTSITTSSGATNSDGEVPERIFLNVAEQPTPAKRCGAPGSSQSCEDPVGHSRRDESADKEWTNSAPPWVRQERGPLCGAPVCHFTEFRDYWPARSKYINWDNRACTMVCCYQEISTAYSTTKWKMNWLWLYNVT